MAKLKKDVESVGHKIKKATEYIGHEIKENTELAEHDTGLQTKKSTKTVYNKMKEAL